MAKEEIGQPGPQPKATGEKQTMGIQLVPTAGADHPVFANFSMVHPASGVALIDFGFLDPGTVNAVSQLAKAGKKTPERLNARLAVRVALTYDGLANLHRQTSAILQELSRAAKKRAGGSETA